MKKIVITGSTRGIGFGLADAFLALDCAVMISGRAESSVEAAIQQLATKHNLKNTTKQLAGCACDVTLLEQVQTLWTESQTKLGGVDIWINNAGIGQPMQSMWELPPTTLQSIINTNILGLMYGCRVAIKEMLEQGYGQIYNMEGAGSDGRVRHGLGVYGSSKAAITYLSKALVEETKDTPLQIGTLSPGMVVTDLVIKQLKENPEMLARSRRILNIVCDTVENVTPYLAKKVLENDKSGTRIAWLSKPKMFKRFLTAPFNKRDLFAEVGL